MGLSELALVMLIHGARRSPSVNWATDVTHERARLVLTLIGAVTPTLMLGSIFFLLDGSRGAAAFAGLMIILSCVLIMVGQVAFILMAMIWNCGECGRRYFDFFMPFWPLQGDCQNCHLSD